MKYISSKDASEILGVNISTLKRWTDNGTLKCTKTAGGHRKFTIQHIRDYYKYNEKAGKSYPTVCSKIAKNTPADKADLESYVDWMKVNKYIIEHDNTEKPVVSNGVASTASSSATFDKF